MNLIFVKHNQLVLDVEIDLYLIQIVLPNHWIGFKRPRIILISVDLPEPFGPISAQNSPSFTFKIYFQGRLSAHN